MIEKPEFKLSTEGHCPDAETRADPAFGCNPDNTWCAFDDVDVHLVAGSDGSPSNFVASAPEQAAPNAFQRSPLRDGTLLDDLHPDRPLTNSVFERSDFEPIVPPPEPSEAFASYGSIKCKLQEMATNIERIEPRDLPRAVVKKLAPFFRPKSKAANSSKLPKHLTNDPIDPVVIFKNAVPLVHRVLLRDPNGEDGLDFDGIAYIIERLEQAKQLRVHQSDIRFDVLEALSRLLSTLLAKAHAEVLA